MLHWCQSVSEARREFTIQDDLGQMKIFHPRNMPCPSQFAFQQHGLDADDVCPLQNYDVVDEVAPVYMFKMVEAELMQVLQDFYVVLVGDPRFRAV